MLRFGHAPKRQRPHCLWFGLVTRVAVVLALGGALTVRSQNPLTRALVQAAGGAEATNSAAIAPRLETPQERLAGVRAELAVQRGTLPNGFLRRGFLQRLERLYEQQINYAAEVEALKAQREAVTREAKAWNGFAEPRPYSIFLTDNLRESIRVELLEITKAESALSTLQRLIEEHRHLLMQSEERIRQLNEELESDAGTSERTRTRELERLRSQTATATIAVLDLDRRIRKERLETSRVRLDLLRRQLVLANAATAFTDADLQKLREINEAAQQHVQRELAEAEARQSTASHALETAVQELRRIQAEAAASGSAIGSAVTGSAVTGSSVAEAQERVELRRTQQDTVSTALNVLRFILQADTIAHLMWEARFESYRSQSAERIRLNETRLREFRDRVALWKDYYASQLEGASSQVALQEERLATMDSASSMAGLVRDRLATLRERDQLLLRVVRRIERGDRLVQRLAESLREASDSLPLSARLRNAVSDTRSLAGRLWHLELLSAQDTIVVDGQQITGKRSVTLGKIISAILILVIGYWITDLLSRLIEPIVISRFKIDVNQASLIRRWLRVALVLSLAVLSLIFVKIPLTIFAFAGGALMIALGFGMQTLLKNFVSGIIILFERPFRVGDVLDVAGQRGKVIGVGIRSSVLQLFDSTETLIPNSTLLENSVTNWTYSNRKVRFIVTVGVAYGSDTRRVVQLLTEITERHGLVEKDPAPQIFLSEFADSALTFEVRFWIDVIKANAAQVASDLRQMIAVAFAEHGIQIAFPQRDVHIDAIRPLHVQLLSPETRPPALRSAAEGRLASERDTGNGEQKPATEGSEFHLSRP